MKVLILTSDCLADLEKKGELIPRYYNPGNIFNVIYIPEFYGKDVTKANLQKSTGKAKTEIIPTKICRLRRYIMMIWPALAPHWVLKKLISLIKKNNIDVIRCYGHRFNLVLGVALKKATNIPLVVSLHINPDLDILGKESNLFLKSILMLFDKTETKCLLAADMVIGVYRSIIPYLQKRKILHYKIIYNAVQKIK